MTEDDSGDDIGKRDTDPAPAAPADEMSRLDAIATKLDEVATTVTGLAIAWGDLGSILHEKNRYLTAMVESQERVLDALAELRGKVDDIGDRVNDLGGVMQSRYPADWARVQGHKALRLAQERATLDDE